MDSHVKTWLQRFAVGVAITVTGGGIVAVSNVIINTLQATARIEAKVEDIGADFDRFTDIRYQQDLEQIGEEFARVNDRIDKAITP